MGKMAILVDGGFYLKRAKCLKGSKTPEARAEELVQYCKKHTSHENAELYRIYLAKKRKVALRKGEELEGSCEFVLKRESARDLCRGKKKVEQLTDDDYILDVQQKGVDVRIGLDVALLAHERFVDQMVLITGDSDFVPAAKYARRHGIDFILDPMWHNIRPELSVHIDGMYTPCQRRERKK